MFKFSYRRLFLFGTMAALLGALLLMPTARSLFAGTTRDTAPLMAPGIYPDEYRPGGQSAWYNVSGTVGANLTVIIIYTLDNASYLFLFAPNGNTLDTGLTESGVDIVSTICDSNQLYSIRINAPVGVRIPGADVPFTLTICLDDNCGQTNGGIPGFLLFYAVFGIVTLLGLAIFSRRRISSII